MIIYQFKQKNGSTIESKSPIRWSKTLCAICDGFLWYPRGAFVIDNLSTDTFPSFKSSNELFKNSIALLITLTVLEIFVGKKRQK